MHCQHDRAYDAPDDPRDLAPVIAAITVLRLHERLDALEGKLDGIHEVSHTMRDDLRLRSRRADLITIASAVVKGAWVFSSQLSVVFCAGYVWFAHQRYVEEVMKWVSMILSWRL